MAKEAFNEPKGVNAGRMYDFLGTQTSARLRVFLTD